MRGIFGRAALAVGISVAVTVGAAPLAAAQPAPDDELDWGPCPAEYELDPASEQCGSVTVPRNYADPAAGTIDVLVTRHRAEDPTARRGVLFTNPGGPGGDAIGSNSMFVDVLPDAVRAQWDVIGVQPRGLPYAGAVDCALSPEQTTAMSLGFGGAATRAACESAAPGTTAHLTTENTARDWEQVRAALGEDVVDIYGLSYGTILGSTYATLFPQHTGRMVLDSAVDQKWLWNDVLWQQNDGYKQRFYDLMDWVAAHDDTYGLGDTPLKVYQRWSDRIVEEAGGNPTLAPPPAQVGDVPPGLESLADAYRGGVDLTGPARVQFEAFIRGIANPSHAQTSSSIYVMTRQLLPARNNWPLLARMVRDGPGAIPEGAGLNDLTEQEYARLLQSQTMQTLVLCNENAVAARPDRIPGWLFSTFVTGDLFDLIGYGYSSGTFCAGAPPVVAPPALSNRGLATAPLVLQGLRDPQTPYQGGMRLAHDMGANLVTVGGGDHGAGIQGGNAVVDRAVTSTSRPGTRASRRHPRRRSPHRCKAHLSRRTTANLTIWTSEALRNWHCARHRTLHTVLCITSTVQFAVDRLPFLRRHCSPFQPPVIRPGSRWRPDVSGQRTVEENVTATPPPAQSQDSDQESGTDSGLGKGLKKRHMNLIALGGVIGAGLFVGSGVVIESAGPAAIVSFLIAGVITLLIMRMLAEMAVARPVVGSFYVYAREALGNRAGFSVGWMYWYFFVIVVAVEAIAGGRILQLYLPSAPLWILSLGLLVLLTCTNLVSARSFGEFEYWFSSIKVIAIVLFLGLGALWITGMWPDSTPGVANLVDHGGFAPLGWGAVLAAVVPCVAFFTGAEIVTIAAAESAEPKKAVARAMRSIVVRIITFYVGSIFVVVAVVPWSAEAVGVSPYAAALSALHIPGVATIMNVVILTAVLSCLNSALYTSSRMLFALTRNGDAPHMFTRLSGGGVPRRAILAGTVIGYASVIAAFVSPDLVFSFLVNSYGAVALFVYLMIAISQVALRRKLEAQDPGALSLKMWLFPWLSYATIALMGTVIAAMAVLPTTRSQFWLSVVTLAFILIGYEFRRRGRTSAERLDTVTPPAEPADTGAEEEQLVGVVTREEH